MTTNWHQITERALRTPQVGKGGENMPRPVMHREFAVYVGCHFRNRGEKNPDGRPMWHVSMNMHSNSQYPFPEWAQSYVNEAYGIAEDIFALVGEGPFFLLKSAMLVMNCARAMKPLEIAVAEHFLPEKVSP